MSDPRHTTNFFWGLPGDRLDRKQTRKELDEMDPAKVAAASRVIDTHVGDPAARALILGALGLQDLTKRQVRRLDKKVAS